MDHPRLRHVDPGEPPAGGRQVFCRSWPSRADLREDILAEVAATLTVPGWVLEQDQAWLRLCLDEALTNALYHGNEGDPHLLVTVTVAVDERDWRVLVADQGNGFEARQVPGQNCQADLEREHGRGIRLMQEWLDALRYWRGGRVVELVRHRADLASAGTAPPPA